jgi:hypothetical protein
MHHPEIYDLLSTVEDFFLLNDSNYRCQIEPQVYSRLRTLQYEEEPTLVNFKGFRIVRELNSGKIEINIFGYCKDNDSMDIQYFCHEEKQSIKVIEILSDYTNTFNLESVRAAIREIMILDRDLTKVTELIM